MCSPQLLTSQTLLSQANIVTMSAAGQYVSGEVGAISGSHRAAPPIPWLSQLWLSEQHSPPSRKAELSS